MPPTIDQIRQAQERIKPFAHRTPVMTSKNINAICGAELFFKCENFQKAGSFKIRGAGNAVFSLSEEEAAKGVATHSSGNFAQALALAAGLRGIPATIVMPSNSPQAKKDAVAGYGGTIVECEPTLEARESTLQGVVDKNGATFLHPYNNYDVIAGQGTCALELIEDTTNLDYIICPVGGGGLLSGTLLSTHYLSPGTKVIAAEPEGADDAYKSIQSDEIIPSIKPDTICDGLLTSLGDKTFPIIRDHVERIVTVPDTDVIRAMRLIWERMKIIIEPSAAVTLAVLLGDKIDLKGKRIGLILSGGNLDLGKLPWQK